VGSSSSNLLFSSEFHPLQLPAPASYFVLTLRLARSLRGQTRLPHPARKSTRVRDPHFVWAAADRQCQRRCGWGSSQKRDESSRVSASLEGCFRARRLQTVGKRLLGGRGSRGGLVTPARMAAWRGAGSLLAPSLLRRCVGVDPFCGLVSSPSILLSSSDFV